MTIAKRLYLFSGIILGIILVIGGIELYFINLIKVDYSKTVEVIMPAQQQLIVADMFHDGIKGNTMQALYYTEIGNKDKAAEAEKDTLQMTKDIREQIKSVDEANISPEIEEAVQKVLPDIEEYSKAAESILEKTHHEKIKENSPELATLLGKFETLEESLGKLREMFDSYSQEELKKGKSESNMGFLVTILIACLSLIFVGFFSWFNVRFISRNLSKIQGTLSTEYTNLMTSLDQVRKASHQFSEATTQQAAAIEETVASMEEMTSMISQTSKNSEDSKEIAQNGRDEGQKGNEVVGKLTGAMGEIHQANEQLQDIVKLIEEIKNKTKVINDIVFETRLLAFNASIEAARAGVHGKGFSVVAEEVGKLASMSGKAADEIRTLLEDSTSQVTKVVGSTGERVNVGRRIAEECAESFKNVGESLEKITSSVQSISAATKEQSVGVGQTNKAMQELDHVTQKSARNASLLSQQSDELASSADKLHSAMESLNELITGSKVLDRNHKYGGDGTGMAHSSVSNFEKSSFKRAA